MAIYYFNSTRPENSDEIQITDKSLKWTEIDPRNMVVSASINSFEVPVDGGGVAVNWVKGARVGVPGEHAFWIQVVCELGAWNGSHMASNNRLCYHVTAFGQVERLLE